MGLRPGPNERLCREKQTPDKMGCLQFLYEGNNFNHQNHLKIIKIKDISNLSMNFSSNHYYNLSIIYLINQQTNQVINKANYT